MPFSSGSYSLPALNPVVTASAISSTWANNTLSDIATALSTCVLKDGTQIITANIPMAGFKFTGLGAGSAAGNSVRWEQTGPGILTTTGDIMYASSANTPARLAVGAADLPLVVNAGATAPQWGFATKTANTVYAGPTSGGAAAPAFRALVPADASWLSATQTFLGGDVALNNTANYFNVVNTGSIGASGQTWLLIASVVADDTAGAARILARIWDTSTVFTEATFTIPAVNQPESAMISAIVTPAGAATYHLSCKDVTSTSGVARTTSAAGTANKATYITAIRLL